jgi:hypothetical protein
VIATAGERFAKTLYSTKQSAELPYLVSVKDEAAQASYVADHVLQHRRRVLRLTARPCCSAPLSVLAGESRPGLRQAEFTAHQIEQICRIGAVEYGKGRLEPG